MFGKWFVRVIQAAAITLAVSAICQELEKPKIERNWYGKIAGFVPYDFRMSTIAKLKESWWNSYDSRVFTPRVFGIGWAINFPALLERLGVFMQDDVSEESFLMPTPSIKELIENPHTLE
ncbi:DUF5808 domain-containing protein [Chloroflexota bacterium]